MQNKKKNLLLKLLFEKKYLIFNLTTFTFVIYFLYNYVNQQEFINILSDIEIKGILILFCFFIVKPFLTTVRWYLIVENFSKISFLEYYKNIITGHSFNLITNSAVAIELVKLMKIKNEIGIKKGIFLILFDRGITLIVKFAFIIAILNILNIYNFNQNIYGFVILSILIFLSIYYFGKNFVKLINFFSIHKILKINLNQLNQVFNVIIKNIIPILFLNIITQFSNIYFYYLIFDTLGSNFDLYELSIYVQVIDFISQFQFIIFGLKEISMVYLAKFINISSEIAFAGALLHKFVDIIVIATLFFLFNILKVSYKSKIK